MSTKINFQTWSGGSGCGDKSILIGYCKESPKEVLEKVYQKYNIYHYKDLYRPVDYNYPNNVEGLIIKEVTDVERTRETFENGISAAKDWHLRYNIEGKKYPNYDKCKEQIEEVADITLKMSLKG